MRPITARAAVAAAAAALLAAGCTSSSERMYYQTRYLPTEGGDALYVASERARWSGDAEVYELPSHPPGDDHVVRRNCLPPGVRFKEPPLVGIHDSGPATGVGPAQTVGNWDERPQPVDRLGPDYGLPIADQTDEGHGPALVNRLDQQAGSWDNRARSRTGAGVGVTRGEIHGVQRDQDPGDWCLDPQLPPETAPARPER
jgi:hypothetical protein